ncbi:hypothetical protein C2S52_000514 [Perilla frutescens var. hirtella]|nr:hypothetical protein C2S51_007899 [Perilla frutescens var. frutescens]KAH6800050.1 hypothetical protein C2S52_000514 [Perilla frutescens var. hirtella]
MNEDGHDARRDAAQQNPPPAINGGGHPRRPPVQPPGNWNNLPKKRENRVLRDIWADIWPPNSAENHSVGCTPFTYLDGDSILPHFILSLLGGNCFGTAGYVLESPVLDFTYVEPKPHC